MEEETSFEIEKNTPISEEGYSFADKLRYIKTSFYCSIFAFLFTIPTVVLPIIYISEIQSNEMLCIAIIQILCICLLVMNILWTRRHLSLNKDHTIEEDSENDEVKKQDEDVA
jgi:hypothetical protein